MILSSSQQLYNYLDANPALISPVVEFDPQNDKLLEFDFTSANKELKPQTVADTYQFSLWINSELNKQKARYGIGGYNEHRTLYARSAHFNTFEEPRRLHLGTDIWGPAGTRVYAPLHGKVHSLKFNNNFGDYGATIVLKHNLDGLIVYSLYGHLNLASLHNLTVGEEIAAGQYFTQFGIPTENGHWPPHLHFQLMFDMGYFKGDYPGVCRFTQRDIFLQNCPDPMSVLKYSFK
ncbi:MAG: peptidoglycan DD-metalloendopeptidase family protein [Daejeonella sp.]